MVNNYEIIPFHVLLDSTMSANKISSPDLSVLVDGEISERSIRNYRNCWRVPKFRYAKLLLNAIHVEISDDDLKKSLELSKVQLENERLVDKSIAEKRFVLNLTDFDFGPDIDDPLEVIQKRIEEKFGYGKSNFSDYVKWLITEDINKNVR